MGPGDRRDGFDCRAGEGPGDGPHQRGFGNRPDLALLRLAPRLGDGHAARSIGQADHPALFSPVAEAARHFTWQAVRCTVGQAHIKKARLHADKSYMAADMRCQQRIIPCLRQFGNIHQ